MAVKGMLMAGGEGTRLRPLTLNLPKPLCPVLGRPVMAYAFELLARHGITQAGVTVCCKAPMIRAAFGDAYQGVAITYYEEKEPLGTAGSVGLARGFLDDTFIVLSGDGLTDCNLTQALEFHRERGALATLVLKGMAAPLAYGVVITGTDGRVQRFVEKPGWSEVFSDQVNTGIYILEPQVLALIPPNGSYDFGRDLFPRMVAEGLPIYGWGMGGYWCDIGDQSAYLQAQLDLLGGQTELPLPGRWRGNCRVMPGAQLHPQARVEGLCFVDEGAQVEAGAVLGSGAVIGRGARVSRGARVERACLWPGAQAEACTSLTGAVLCSQARAGFGASMAEGSALGDGAVLGEHARLHPGVKVWAGREVEARCQARENVVWGDVRQLKFLQGLCTVDSAAQADSLAGALIAQGREILLGQDGESAPLFEAFRGALTSRGARVWAVETATLPAMAVLQRELGFPLGAFITGQRIALTQAGGVPLDKELQRKLQNAAILQDYPPPFIQTGEAAALGEVRPFYIAALLRVLPQPEKLPSRAALYCRNPWILGAAQLLIDRLGLIARLEAGEPAPLGKGEVGVWISPSGDGAWLMDETGIPAPFIQELLKYRAILRQAPPCFFLPPQAPRGVTRLALPGTVVLPPGQGTAADRFSQQLWERDGLALAVLWLIQLGREEKRLSDWVAELPPLYQESREIPCPTRLKGRVLRQMYAWGRQKESREGLRLYFGENSAHLMPLAQGAAFRVTGESADAEFAKELCSHFAARVERLAKDVPSQK